MKISKKSAHDLADMLDGQAEGFTGEEVGDFEKRQKLQELAVALRNPPMTEGQKFNAKRAVKRLLLTRSVVTKAYVSFLPDNRLIVQLDVMPGCGWNVKHDSTLDRSTGRYVPTTEWTMARRSVCHDINATLAKSVWKILHYTDVWQAERVEVISSAHSAEPEFKHIPVICFRLSR